VLQGSGSDSIRVSAIIRKYTKSLLLHSSTNHNAPLSFAPSAKREGIYASINTQNHPGQRSTSVHFLTTLLFMSRALSL